MKFPAKASNDFEICPSGNHVGICNAVVDLGVQPGSGQYPDPKHQVYIRFELPSEQITYQKDGKEITGPMSIGRTFTASMSQKANLRQFIESWFGRAFPSDDAAADFDLQKLLGKRCLLNVTHTEKSGKTYANLKTATPLPKGMQSTEPQHNASLFFDLQSPDPDVYHALPEWLRKKIDGRIVEQKHDSDPGYAMADDVAGGGLDPSDDIPFGPRGKWD